MSADDGVPAVFDNDLTPPMAWRRGDRVRVEDRIDALVDRVTPLERVAARTRDLAWFAIGMASAAVMTGLVLLAVLASHGLR